MMIFRWIEEPFAARENPWWVPGLAGLALVGFGLLIVFVPQILSALVAGFVISAGISLIAMAWRVHASRRPHHGMRGGRRVVHVERFFHW